MSTKTPETDDKFEYLMRFLSLTQGWEAAGKMRDFARSIELRNAELTARIAELEVSLSAQRDSTALYQSQLKRLCELAKTYQARVLLSQVAQNDYRMYNCAENATAVSEASCAECDAMEAMEGLIKAALPATPLPKKEDR